jgi:hypothetical protein
MGTTIFVFYDIPLMPQKYSIIRMRISKLKIENF